MCQFLDWSKFKDNPTKKPKKKAPHHKTVLIKVILQGAFPSGIGCFSTVRELASELFFFSAAKIMVEGDLILTGAYF